MFNLISVLGCWPGVDSRIAVKQPEVCFVNDFNRVAAWLGNNTDVIETLTYSIRNSYIAMIRWIWESLPGKWQPEQTIMQPHKFNYWNSSCSNLLLCCIYFLFLQFVWQLRCGRDTKSPPLLLYVNLLTVSFVSFWARVPCSHVACAFYGIEDLCPICHLPSGLCGGSSGLSPGVVCPGDS